MKNSMDEMLLETVAKGQISDLISLPETVFNGVMEIVRRKRLEAQGFRVIDENNPATCETCEG